MDEGNETKPWHRDASDKGPGPTHAPVLGQPAGPGNVLPKDKLTQLAELAEHVSVGLAELRRGRHVHMRGL